MHVTFSTKNVELPEPVHRRIDRMLDRLRKRLKHFNPDLIEVSLVLEKVRNRSEFRSTLNCRLPMKTLHSTETAAAEYTSAHKAFENVERQLDRFLARLRREDERPRK